MENNTAIQNNSADIITLAAEKIKAEFDNFKGGTKEKAVSSYVCTILQDFCRQDERFAEVIYKFKRTLSDCCADIMRGVGSHISDIDVYRSAVKFYFPNSEVSMNMTIEITGDAPGDDEILKEAEKPKKKAAKTEKKPKNTAKSKADTKTPAPESEAKTEDKSVPVKKEKKSAEKKNEDSGYIQLTLF